VGLKKENTLVLVHFLDSISQQKINVCSTAFDINSLKSSLLYFTSQPYCKNCRSVKIKHEIINYLVDQYNHSGLLKIISVNFIKRKATAKHIFFYIFSLLVPEVAALEPLTLG
jgi:hypothetical protein